MRKTYTAAHSGGVHEVRVRRHRPGARPRMPGWMRRPGARRSRDLPARCPCASTARSARAHASRRLRRSNRHRGFALRVPTDRLPAKGCPHGRSYCFYQVKTPDINSQLYEIIAFHIDASKAIAYIGLKRQQASITPASHLKSASQRSRHGPFFRASPARSWKAMQPIPTASYRMPTCAAPSRRSPRSTRTARLLTGRQG